ncbi:MAG TPA: class I SAM-dependent methyltransferase [Candidatus Kapabacteria bacterium]|nr:class I SAM-dependent methyltransferase [Candidatus Kapabacteria bacterium]
MNRIEIINSLIEKNGYESYLEVGCGKGKTFNSIVCKNKIGIDIDGKVGINTSSDEYFKSIDGTDVKFDIIFIDGLHHKEQALRDIKNGLKFLTKKGIIVVHDCLPWDEDTQKVPRIQKSWTGDVWKAIVELRKTLTSIEVETINTDCGCALVRFGKQEKINIKINIDYKNFVKNKVKWMKVISVDEFKEKYL